MDLYQRTKHLRRGSRLMVQLILLALFFGLAAPAQAQDEVAAIEALLDDWATSYSASGATPEQMLRLYHPDSVFWGTGSQTPFVGADEIGPYFGQQFENFPQRQVSFIEPVIRIYGDTATASGLYRFQVRTRAEDMIDVTHRFSFAFHREDGDWIIVHQHSSQRPQ